LSVELCACLEVYNDGRWNCVLVEYLIMIDVEIVWYHYKLLNTTAIPPTIVIS
jgi:hypothetical protein